MMLAIFGAILTVASTVLIVKNIYLTKLLYELYTTPSEKIKALLIGGVGVVCGAVGAVSGMILVLN